MTGYEGHLHRVVREQGVGLRPRLAAVPGPEDPAAGLLACPDLLPDLDELVGELRPALDELLATVREETPR